MFKKMNQFSKTGIKLLSHMVKNPSRELYQREIARETGISIGAVNQYLQEFLEMGIVSSKRRGRMFFYSLNLDNPVVRQFKVFLTVAELNPLIERVRKNAERIILFGSCSEGTDMEESDVDLFILTESKKEVREKLSRAKLERKLSPIIVNSNEFVKLRKEDKPLYERVVKGIELWRNEQ